MKTRRVTRLLPLYSALFALALSGCAKEGTEEAAATDTPATTDAVQAPESTAAAESDALDVQPGAVPEVVVLWSDELIPWLESEGWWGPVTRGEQLTVPHLMIAAIKPSWVQVAQQMPVPMKKSIFYRLMLPLVMHANEMVVTRRGWLQEAKKELESDGKVSAQSLARLQRLALLLPGFDEERAGNIKADDPELAAMVDDLLYRVDIVPPGLALGQAAYESGYGTSRFAVQGNALFGQWTYGDQGIKPKEQRASKGDHRIKAFEWPFDSVRGYFINLMSHRAYEDFRRLRAQLRAEGKPFDSLVLADGLLSYSERGQEYVDSLKGMIRANKLDVADDAVFRDEPIRFIVTEQDKEAVDGTRAELLRMRESGELADIFERMNLD